MSAYTNGVQNAAILGDMGDNGSFEVGVVTKATSSTTAIVTHGLAGTPDFILCDLQADAGATALIGPSKTANSTTVTFTIGTAQTAWSVAYIIGYTA
jgi:hypothetical protein